MEKISKNISETEKIAEEFLKNILNKKNKNAIVVGLYGDLGVGKTAFTQVIGKILKIKRKINSPTYVIIKSYPIGKISDFKLLIHIDAYRLKNEKELLHLGWEELISKPENLIFIEWPELVIKAMPKKHHKIEIFHTKEGYRKFKIN